MIDRGDEFSNYYPVYILTQLIQFAVMEIDFFLFLSRLFPGSDFAKKLGPMPSYIRPGDFQVIWEPGFFVDDGCFDLFACEVQGLSQIRSRQVCSVHLCGRKVGAIKFGMAEVRFCQVGFNQIGLAESGVVELRITQSGFSEIGFSEIGVAEPGFCEVGSGQVRFDKVSPSEIGVRKVGSAEIGALMIFFVLFRPFSILLFLIRHKFG